MGGCGNQGTGTAQEAAEVNRRKAEVSQYPLVRMPGVNVLPPRLFPGLPMQRAKSTSLRQPFTVGQLK